MCFMIKNSMKFSSAICVEYKRFKDVNLKMKRTVKQFSKKDMTRLPRIIKICKISKKKRVC